MKIVLCGSMTASKRMLSLEVELRRLGHEAVLPRFARDYAQLGSPEEMHRESAENKMKFDLIRDYWRIISTGDAILVVNETRHGIENYVGGNTLLEMGFAHVQDKPVYFLNPLPQMQYTDELKAMQPVVLNGDLTRLAIHL